MVKEDNARLVLPVEGIRNARDLGGIPAADGKRVRPHLRRGAVPRIGAGSQQRSGMAG